MKSIKKLISFSLIGKFAHFRKFYTNSSSLSYLIPPRTVITGLLGSVLNKERDSYYELFNEDFCKISVRISENSNIKKKMQSMNNLHVKYYKFLNKGAKKIPNMHSQCKLELLSSDTNIEYEVFIGFTQITDIVNIMTERLIRNENGYGFYMGQKQFRAIIDKVQVFDQDDIIFPKVSNIIHTLVARDNIIKFDITDDLNFISERMPVQMKKDIIKKKVKGKMATIDNGRILLNIETVFFERNGKPVHGEFKNCCLCNDLSIGFY